MDTAVSINLSRGQSEIFEELQNLPMKDGIRIFVDRSGKIEDGWCVGAEVVFLPGKFWCSMSLYGGLLKGIGTDYLYADLKLRNVEEAPRLRRVLRDLVPQLGSMGVWAFAIVIPEMQRRRNLQRWREMYWEDSIEYAGGLARRLNGTATLYSDAFRGKENQDEIRAFRKAFDRLGRPPYIEPYLYLCDSRGHLGIFLADVIAGSLRNFFLGRDIQEILEIVAPLVIAAKPLPRDAVRLSPSFAKKLKEFWEIRSLASKMF